jgi:hypothetical protein
MSSSLTNYASAARNLVLEREKDVRGPFVSGYLLPPRATVTPPWSVRRDEVVIHVALQMTSPCAMLEDVSRRVRHVRLWLRRGYK